MNCNQIDPKHWSDRCDCNMRVLRALNRIRVIVSDPTQSPNSTPANIQDAVQQERLHRLRTFIAPSCELPSTGKLLPAPDEHSGSSSLGNLITTRLQPLATKAIDGTDSDGSDNVDPGWLLEGRWQGWQTLSDGKPTPIFFHIIEVNGKFVKACSDQGMVFGMLRGRFLELPRSESPGLAYSIRLWRGTPPYFRDLEGVALLELRPTEEIVAGLVWLVRAPKLYSSLMPTGYFCEDRELEDRRHKQGIPELKGTIEPSEFGGFD